MHFYFCESCGVRLTQSDLETGAGQNKKLKGVFCASCAAGIETVETLPVNEEQARRMFGLDKDTTELEEPIVAPATPDDPPSGRRENSERASSNPVAVFGFTFLGAALLAVFLLLVFHANPASGTASNAPMPDESGNDVFKKTEEKKDAAFTPTEGKTAKKSAERPLPALSTLRPGLLGFYYDRPLGVDAAKPAKLRRVDPKVEVKWSSAQPPIVSSPTKEFSIRWVGYLNIGRGRRYVFWMSNEAPGSSVRLSIDGRVVLASAPGQRTNENSVECDLSTGLHALEIDFDKRTQSSRGHCTLQWTLTSNADRAIVPAQFLFHDPKVENPPPYRP